MVEAQGRDRSATGPVKKIGSIVLQRSWRGQTIENGLRDISRGHCGHLTSGGAWDAPADQRKLAKFAPQLSRDSGRLGYRKRHVKGRDPAPPASRPLESAREMRAKTERLVSRSGAIAAGPAAPLKTKLMPWMARSQQMAAVRRVITAKGGPSQYYWKCHRGHPKPTRSRRTTARSSRISRDGCIIGLAPHQTDRLRDWCLWKGGRYVLRLKRTSAPSTKI